MVELCYFCRGTIEQQDIDVDFRWGKKLKVIRSVPAGICRQCGERYFDADVYKAMEKACSVAAQTGDPGGRRCVRVPCGGRAR